MSSTYLLFDACCLLNLCASGYLLDILETIPFQGAMVQEVQRELQTIENVEQFERAINGGLLRGVDFASDAEMARFVNDAVTLDDGEAATGAIAIERHWTLATDERKARSFFPKKPPTSRFYLLWKLSKIGQKLPKLNE
ncbi:hypothetical protein [Spirulina subsalsa]|uniref:hypothetical protein n=1 Tax=Spirulina subsalsa TaxID=54311 RepID=UPI0002D83E9B|nr:hypothetical protein [Spirulina subsalsa]